MGGSGNTKHSHSANLNQKILGIDNLRQTHLFQLCLPRDRFQQTWAIPIAMLVTLMLKDSESSLTTAGGLEMVAVETLHHIGVVPLQEKTSSTLQRECSLNLNSSRQKNVLS